MEGRIAKLEEKCCNVAETLKEMCIDIKDIRDRSIRSEAVCFDIKDVRERSIRSEEAIKYLPTKAWVDTRLLAMLAALTTLITFQTHIQGWLGIVGH